jgi:uncharacterized protein YchJ
MFDAITRMVAFAAISHRLAPRYQLWRPLKIKRNDPCLCGSGRKFKGCCGKP